ncbi:hypothetical protein ACIP5Y_00110 [Nocardia sp. NPDC088792]|uniref:hypothetical protein n=1 Tax=Nocardia sp. NPDC088792 TaxID=3364332 RepID=UPI003808FD3E
MGSYTVIIFPDTANGKEDSSDVPRLTIRVDAAEPDMCVAGIAISTTALAGLTAQKVLGIDIAAIVAALARRFPPTDSPAASTGSLSLAPARPLEQMALIEEASPAAPIPARVPHSVEAEAGRAYRRMPDIGELRATYERMGTVTAVARHYGVPRHTAQGWIGRLRKLDRPSETGSANNNQTVISNGSGEQ